MRDAVRKKNVRPKANNIFRPLRGHRRAAQRNIFTVATIAPTNYTQPLGEYNDLQQRRDRRPCRLRTAAILRAVSNVGSFDLLSGGAQILQYDSQVKISGVWRTLLSAVNIGATASANGNSAIITDAGSLVNASIVDVGADGSGNSLTVANGGVVSAAYGIIGSNAMASGNSILLTGTGSIWSNGTLLAIGGQGSNNSMTVTDGAKVVSACADAAVVVGVVSNNMSNSLLITGSGSSVQGYEVVGRQQRLCEYNDPIRRWCSQC